MNAVAEGARPRRHTAHGAVAPCWPEHHHLAWLEGAGHEHLALAPGKGAAPSCRPHDAILVTRWRRDEAPASLGSVIPNRHAILTIVLRTTEGTIKVDGSIAHDGRLSTGMFHLALPGRKLQANFRAPADLLRLHVPQGLLAASGAHLLIGHSRAARLAHDPLIEQLALAIVAATAGAQPADKFVLDAMSTALLARAHIVLSGGAPAGPRAGGLVPWRLKRVADFVDARLEEPLSLADLARAAGLSPMHFAAQFRLATGFTPREYLTRRRIDRARDLLRHSTLPIVEVALNVGFQTQAHFTTVFRRLSGAPPGRWREREAAHADHAALYLDASARTRGRVDG